MENDAPNRPDAGDYARNALKILRDVRHANRRAAAAFQSGHAELAASWARLAEARLQDFDTVQALWRSEQLIRDLSGVS